VTTLTCYIKNICGVFCAKTSHTHTHSLGTSEMYFMYLVKMAFYHPFKLSFLKSFFVVAEFPSQPNKIFRGKWFLKMWA